jgi:hypothetical protein
MKESKIEINDLMNEILSVVHKFGLNPKFCALTLQIPKQEFSLLSQQFPDHHPKLISISNNNEWMIDFSPVLEVSEYPNALDLKPDTFRKELRKKSKSPKRNK